MPRLPWKPLITTGGSGSSPIEVGQACPPRHLILTLQPVKRLRYMAVGTLRSWLAYDFGIQRGPWITRWSQSLEL